MIPNLLTNLILSAFSLDTGNTVSTTCTAFGFALLYSYLPRWLIILYSVAVYFAIIAIVLVMLSLRNKGGPSRDTFSQILLMERNPALDEVLLKNVSSDVTVQELLKRRVMLGEVKESDTVSGDIGNDTGHIAFAFEGQVMRLRGKAKMY